MGDEKAVENYGNPNRGEQRGFPSATKTEAVQLQDGKVTDVYCLDPGDLANNLEIMARALATVARGGSVIVGPRVFINRTLFSGE